MDIRVLRYFLTVAKEESINGAANFLHISQPTLSRQLMDLEEELGKKLFIRGNRKIILTEEGVFLKKRAEEIVELLDKTEAEFHENDELISGDICIGGGETEAIRLIAKIAKTFQQDYPQVKYHIFSGNADDVIDRLDKGLLDFGILIEPVDISKYDFITIPYSDVWGVLMPKSSPLATKPYITATELINIPILASRQNLMENSISSWLGKSYLDLNIVTTYNLIYNASILVEEGIGYALALDKLINTSGNSKLCFKPLYPPLEAKLYLVWKKYQVFSKAGEKFLERIKKEFNEIK